MGIWKFQEIYKYQEEKKYKRNVKRQRKKYLEKKTEEYVLLNYNIKNINISKKCLKLNKEI